MTIGTSDGKSYKNEMSYLLDQHENLSQESQVADLDRRTPPPLPMVPSHSIAPHNPNPPGGGPYNIKPGERLADVSRLLRPANDNRNLQIDTPGIDAQIDREWNSMVKKGNQPTLKIIPGGKQSMSDESPDSVRAGQQYAQTLPDYAQDLQQKEYKKHWENMSKEDFRARVRNDAERNVMAPILWRSQEYFKMWEEERDKIGKEYQMSPKQLRDKGIKP